MNRATRRHLTLRKQIQRVNRLRFCDGLDLELLSARDIGRLKDTPDNGEPDLRGVFKGKLAMSLQDLQADASMREDMIGTEDKSKEIRARARIFIETWLTEGFRTNTIDDVRGALSDLSEAFSEYKKGSISQIHGFSKRQFELWNMLMEHHQQKGAVSV